MLGDKGWALPVRARVHHFFRADGWSECKRYQAPATARPEDFVPATGDETPRPTDCSACWDRLHHRPPLPDGGA